MTEKKSYELLVEQATFEELLDLYEGITKPANLTREGLWQVRFWDGMDGTWSDHGAAMPRHEALKEWFLSTEGGENFVDYFRIFPAATTMKWSNGEEMFRGDAGLPEPEPVGLPQTKRPRRKWEFDMAAQYVSALEKGLSAVGWHIAMTGSVLHLGESAHDLDVIIYPHNTVDNVDLEVPRKVLGEYGMKLTHPVEVVHETWRKKGGTDTKHVEVWSWHHLRIDVFFLR